MAKDKKTQAPAIPTPAAEPDLSSVSNEEHSAPSERDVEKTAVEMTLGDDGVARGTLTEPADADGLAARTQASIDTLSREEKATLAELAATIGTGHPADAVAAKDAELAAKRKAELDAAEAREHEEAMADRTKREALGDEGDDGDAGSDPAHADGAGDDPSPADGHIPAAAFAPPPCDHFKGSAQIWAHGQLDWNGKSYPAGSTAEFCPCTGSLPLTEVEAEARARSFEDEARKLVEQGILIPLPQE